VIFICFLLVLDAVILCRRRSDVVTFVAVTVGFALVGLGSGSSRRTPRSVACAAH